MARFEYLSEEWVQAVNGELGKGRRPAVLQAPGECLALKLITSERTIFLSDSEGVPRIDFESTGKIGSTVVVPDESLRRAFIEGDVPGLLGDYHSGKLEFEGNREVALYFLYHLLPGGTKGIKQISNRIKAMTL